MNYDKIKELLTDKRITMKAFSESIGMSRRGLYAAIDNKTLTIETLEKIAEALEVPVKVFFETGSENEIDFLKKELETVKELNKAQAAYLVSMDYEQGKQNSLLNLRRAVLRLIYSRIKLSYQNYFDSFFVYPQEEIKEYFNNKFLRDFIHDTLDCYDEIMKAINESEKFDLEKSATKSKLEYSETEQKSVDIDVRNISEVGLIKKELFHQDPELESSIKAIENMKKLRNLYKAETEKDSKEFFHQEPEQEIISKKRDSLSRRENKTKSK